MIEVPDNLYRVPFDGSFRLADAPTRPPADAPERRKLKARLRDNVDVVRQRQQILYAQDKYSVLLVFQAMDAAGKDSTIRAVTRGINPAGCQVFSFKAPSSRELDHDFLWRTAQRLPERGRIGIFNRSYYEETLIVRVHPRYLKYQRLPDALVGDDIWEQRLESIRDHEKHLARNGTVILKFWLNVSQEEQHARFLSRLEQPHKRWKFSMADLEESGHWDDYMHAYEQTLQATSRPWAPWFAIPADDKTYMRTAVSDIIRDTFANLDLAFPASPDASPDELAAARKLLSRGNKED